MPATDMNKKERAFQKLVKQHYQKNGRNLPWRKTKNAYRILVSEIMLQQTQVDRVIPKYTAFLKKFPTLETLAAAPLGDVLREWQGLGYNRRAKMLHACAKAVVTDHAGKLPRTHDALQALPGIGPYTAGAVMAFAYNKPIPIIETNIRTAYIHHFFKGKENVHDRVLMPIIERTLDHENPRDWYHALMDYGAYLKQTVGNANVRSRHYTKQSRFAGSDRQVRGEILRALTEKPMTQTSLEKVVTSPEKLSEQLQALAGEGFINKKGKVWRIVS